MRDAKEVRAVMVEARAWAENNPEAWAYIERRAMEEAGAQRRVSVSRLVEEVRALEWTPRDGVVCARADLSRLVHGLRN